MLVDDKIFKCLAGGIRESTWKAMKDAEKKAYIEKHPKSKYAKKENGTEKCNFDTSVFDAMGSHKEYAIALMKCLSEKPNAFNGEYANANPKQVMGLIKSGQFLVHNTMESETELKEDAKKLWAEKYKQALKNDIGSIEYDRDFVEDEDELYNHIQDNLVRDRDFEDEEDEEDYIYNFWDTYHNDPFEYLESGYDSKEIMRELDEYYGLLDPDYMAEVTVNKKGTGILNDECDYEDIKSDGNTYRIYNLWK